MLSLNGPAESIDLIERSLFSIGVVTQRVNTSDAAITGHAGLLEALLRLQVEAGLLVLQVTVNENEEFVAEARGHRLVLDGASRSSVVSAVHQLLHETEILYDTERAGL
jgi:CRISPR/Cas system-associated exonuclease Cas4 (RecB family)